MLDSDGPQPYPFQVQALDWLSDRPKAFLALEPGLGKSVISALDAEPPAVVVTTSAMIYTFEREIQKWRPDLSTRVVTTQDDPQRDGDDVLIFSWSSMVKHAPKIEPPKTLIVDECHYAKTPKAQRTRAIVKLIKRTPRVRLLSGTPVVSRPMDLFALLSAIGGTKLDWRSFAYKYCAAYEAPFGFVTTGASNLSELHAKTQALMLRMTKDKYMPQLLEPIRRVIELDAKLPPAELPYIAAHIAQPEYSVPFEAISDIRLMGAKMKLPLCIEYVKDVLETEGKLVVFAHHTEIIEALADALKTFNPVIVNGAMDARAKDDAVQAFQSDLATRVLIGNIAAASEAITLTAASRVIFVEVSWNPSAIDQAISRCHRIGQSEQVQADFLITRKSLDSHMLTICLDKSRVIDQIIKETALPSVNKKLTNPCNSDDLPTPTKGNTMNNDKTIAELFALLSEAFANRAQAEPETVEQVAAVVEAIAEPEPAEPAAEKLTLDIVRGHAAKAIADGNRPRVLAALKECGAENLTALAPEKFDDFLERISI